MSTACQAKAARRKIRNGYAHMGNSLRRPYYGGQKELGSIHEAIKREAAKHARINASKGSKKK